MGVAVVTHLTVKGPTLRSLFPSLGSLGDINVGVIALLANTIVLVAISLATHTTMPPTRLGHPPIPLRMFRAKDVRHMTNNRELQEEPRASSGTRTGDKSIEL